MSQENLVFRKMEKTDDAEKVAELIYGTDPYIFPFLFNRNIEEAKKILSEMIFKDTIYNYKNVYVALSDGEIVGIVISQETPVRIDYNSMVNCFAEADEITAKHFTRVYDEYYRLLENEPDGIYIANVCVDSACRGQKVGTKMLSSFLKNDKEYHLESVIANTAATKLYTSMGFAIVCEYPGFTGVPCYRMKRTAEKK